MESPKFLQMPRKLEPLLARMNEFRYHMVDGGRGGGKSQAIARIILYAGETKKLRVVCGREIMNAIAESVYAILVDLIRDHDLSWTIYRDKLVHKVTETEINFKGFREQGRVNIKGLEGVDILWIDEAQSIVQNTLDIIVPTIRKNKSKVFFSMNRYLKTDAVYSDFANREDCQHININFDENPFCPASLIHEAELCKAKSDEDYNHIWLGHPREEADDYLFNPDELDGCKVVDLMDRGQTPDVILGVDIARYGEDKCIGAVLERMTATRFRVSHIERWGKKSLMETVGRIMDMRANYSACITVVDGDGVGGGVYDRLAENKLKNIVEFRGGQAPLKKELYLNRRAEAYGYLKDLVSRGLIRINYDSLLKELETIRFKFDSYGRMAIMRKEDMKKLGIKSPDEADAVMMACSEIKNIGTATSVDRVAAYAQPRYNKKQTILRR